MNGRPFYHLSAAGRLHRTEGFEKLTRCGLHPSASKGWEVGFENLPTILRRASSVCRRCITSDDVTAGIRDILR